MGEENSERTKTRRAACEGKPSMATCAGHGVAMPPRPEFYPENTCWYCHLPYPPPFVPPPPKNCPPDFCPGAYVDGVMRNSTGHISGILWGELRGANAHLLAFKDVAIGPGHPLAEGMNPRSFIPCAAGPRPPVPVPVPRPPPSVAPVTESTRQPPPTTITSDAPSAADTELPVVPSLPNGDPPAAYSGGGGGDI